MLVIPPPPLIKVARSTRPYSKLGGATLNAREEGGQYYISQTCDQERFEARKVVFSWECLNIFATGCSTRNVLWIKIDLIVGHVSYLKFGARAIKPHFHATSGFLSIVNMRFLDPISSKKRQLHK